MRTIFHSFFVFSVVSIGSLPLAAQANDAHEQTETASLFDGKTLEGWDGDPKFWSVEEGAITGRTTAENPTQGNTFLIWRGGTVGDFELTLEYKIIGGNSGIQYRSQEVPDQKWVLAGHQADFEAGDNYSGIHYEEKGRGILALRGQKTSIGDNGKPTVLEEFAKSENLQKHIKKEDWNTYKIIAKGQTFTHEINGHVTSIVIDEDKDGMTTEGLLGLQVHAGPPMTVQFRKIELKKLSVERNGDKQSRLELHENGQLTLDGEKMERDQIIKKLQEGQFTDIVLIAPKQSTYQEVVELVNLVKEAGVRDISLVASKLVH